MILEFLFGLTMALPSEQPNLVPVQFAEPVQRVVTYAPAGQLTYLTEIELPPETRTAFEQDFAAGTLYYGAFAITKDFGYGYVTGANSLEGARDIAMEECLKQGPRCVVFAEITPQGYVSPQPGEVTMSNEAAALYLNPNPEWGRYRAMAISEDGAYSVVWNYGTSQEAANAALADCAQYVITDLPNLRDMPCVLVPFK